jgi:hypothetical protein
MKGTVVFITKAWAGTSGPMAPRGARRPTPAERQPKGRRAIGPFRSAFSGVGSSPDRETDLALLAA